MSNEIVHCTPKPSCVYEMESAILCPVWSSKLATKPTNECELKSQCIPEKRKTAWSGVVRLLFSVVRLFYSVVPPWSHRGPRPSISVRCLRVTKHVQDIDMCEQPSLAQKGPGERFCLVCTRVCGKKTRTS